VTEIYCLSVNIFISMVYLYFLTLTISVTRLWISSFLISEYILFFDDLSSGRVLNIIYILTTPKFLPPLQSSLLSFKLAYPTAYWICLPECLIDISHLTCLSHSQTCPTHSLHYLSWTHHHPSICTRPKT